MRRLVAAGLVLALAGCNEAQPPFERSPPDAAIATALGGLLAADPACSGYSIGQVTAWQTPLELHTNWTSYELKVDAYVMATRNAGAGGLAACFGSTALAPIQWPVGAPGEVRTRGWLDFAGTSWTLRVEHIGSGKTAGSASLPLAPPHPFQLGVSDAPGR